MTLTSGASGSKKITPVARREKTGLRVIFLTAQFIFGAALANLYLSMRGIMKLGGYVSSGGPYLVTHPAPGWTWVMPVSFVLGLLSVLAAFGTGRRLGGPNIMVFSFSAVFVSAGWNFLEFGIKPSPADGPDWITVIQGIVFVVLGFIPLFVMFLLYRTSRRERKLTGKAGTRASGDSNRKFSLILQLSAVGLGIFLGILFFYSLG